MSAKEKKRAEQKKLRRLHEEKRALALRGPKVKLKVKGQPAPVHVHQVSFKLKPDTEAQLRNNAKPDCGLCRGTGVSRWDMKGGAHLCSCVRRAIQRLEVQLQETKLDVEGKLAEAREAEAMDVVAKQLVEKTVDAQVGNQNVEAGSSELHSLEEARLAPPVLEQGGVQRP